MGILNKYKLKSTRIDNIDLRTTFRLKTPFMLLENIWGKTGLMTESPHVECARLYYKHGTDWFKKNYHKTKLFSLRSFGKKNANSEVLCLRFINLCDSLKLGYLSNVHKHGHIAILEVPFCNSRYGLKKNNCVPEVFFGHHRTGILLALEKFVVPVVYCVDVAPGSRYTVGTRHFSCGGVPRK